MKKMLGLLLLCALMACESAEDKAGRFYLMGNEALTAGNYKEAIRLYTESIDKYPELKQVWNNRGVAYYKDRQYTNAINDFNHALLKLDAYFFDAWRNRADAHYDAGMYAEAMKDLIFLGEAWPDSAFVHFKSGLVLIGQKNYRNAVNAFRKAVQKDSSDVESLINLANAFYLYGTTRGGAYFNEVEKHLIMAEKIDPSQGEIYNTRALMNVYSKDYDEALVQVNLAIETEVNNPYFNNNRGFIYLMTGKLDEAEQDINLAIKGDPQNGWAYRNKGMFYYMTENFEAAQRNFTQAALYDDAIPLMHYYWGATLLKLDQKEEACEKLKISVDAFENEGRDLFEANCGT